MHLHAEQAHKDGLTISLQTYEKTGDRQANI